jgi:hypothetical protein
MQEHTKKTIRKGIFFVILFLLIILLLNSIYINIIQKNEMNSRQEAEWQKYKNTLPNNTLHYAFFGDSPVQNGLNPNYINNSFNFAIGGENYVETYYKIKKILEKEDVKINNFVLEIDPHTFSDKIRTEEGLFRDARYFNKFISLDEMSKLKDKEIIPLFLNVHFPILGEGYGIVRYFMLGSELTQTSLGWYNKTSNYSNQDRTIGALSVCNYLFAKEPNLLENKSLNYFKEILKLAKINGIKIIFIEYPFSHEYDVEINKRNISRKIFYDDLFKEIDSETKDYLVLDYYSLFKNNPEFFGDANHLNYAGAEVLSKRINEDLINISLKKNYSFSEEELFF